MRPFFHPLQQRGYVLLSVTLTLLVLGSVSLMLNRQTAMTGELANAQADAAHAKQLAETGLNMIRWTTHRANCGSPTAYSDLSDVSFPAGSANLFSATVSPDTGTPVRYTVTATSADGGRWSAVIDSEAVFQYPGFEHDLAPFDDVDPPIDPDGPGNDTYISDGSDEDTNYGTNNRLRITNDVSKTRSLLAFDLSGIPATADIREATLRLTVQSITSGSNITLFAHRLTRSWLEAGATWREHNGSNNWASEGGDYDSNPAASVAIPNLNSNFYSLDVTGLVKQWVAGTYDNHGFLLDSSSPTTGLKIYSADATGFGALFRPRLTVTFFCQCGDSCTSH